jgi:methyl-accepting chemotaxis protein
MKPVFRHSEFSEFLPHSTQQRQIRIKGGYMGQGSSSSQEADQSIKTRIMLLAGGILLLFALITGYCLYTLFSLQQAGLSVKDGGSSLSLTGSDLQDLLNEARHNADQFIHQQNVESVLHFKSAAERLEELGRQLGLPGSTIDLVRQYDAGFRELVQSWEARGLNSGEGMLRQLTAAAMQLENLLSAEESRSLAEALERIQTAQSGYFHANSADAFRALETAVHDLDPLVQELSTADQEKEMLRQRVKNYTTALNRHQAVSLATSDASLAAIFAAEQQRQAAAMDNTLQRLQTTMHELSLPQLASHLADVRRHEEKYLLQGAKEDADLVFAALDQLAQTTNDASAPEDRKPAILQAVRSYRDFFTALVHQDEVINNRIAEVHHAYSMLEGRLKEADSNTASETAFQSQFPVLPVRVNMFLIAGAVIAAGLFSIIAARRVAESIISPILRLSSNVRRIYSEPDTPVDLAGGRNDELGLLAREVNNLVQVGKISMVFSAPADRTADAGSSPALERINTIAGQINGLCASTVHDFNKIIDQTGMFLQDVEADEIAVANVPGPDRPTAEYADRIGGILKVASDMAEETAILALNAAIKAERAGSRGTEFTVVVEELDKLAKKAKQTSAEISTSLHDIAHLLATDAASRQNGNPDPQSLIGEFRRLTAELEEIGPNILAIGDHVDALQKELAEPDRTGNDQVLRGEDKGDNNGTAEQFTPPADNAGH